MKFTPKTQEELDSMLLMPQGIYKFRVKDAENTMSKSGNEMIKLTMEIYADNKTYVLFDYLLEAMAFKLRQFAEVTGLIDKYEHGEIEDIDCIGKGGHVEIFIDKGKPNPNGGLYPDRNGIKGYLKMSEVSSAEKASQAVEELDDDIPF